MNDRPITADALREIANWLDLYDSMAENYVHLLTLTGLRTYAEAVGPLEMLRDKRMQDDLRRWASEMDAEVQS